MLGQFDQQGIIKISGRLGGAALDALAVRRRSEGIATRKMFSLPGSDRRLTRGDGWKETVSLLRPDEECRARFAVEGGHVGPNVGCRSLE